VGDNPEDRGIPSNQKLGNLDVSEHISEWQNGNDCIAERTGDRDEIARIFEAKRISFVDYCE
jgi:hypothetical protein